MTLWCPHHSNPPCATVREEDWAELKQQDYGNLNMLVGSTLAATTANNKQFLSLIQNVHKNVRKNGNKLLTHLVRFHYYPDKEDDDLVRSAPRLTDPPRSLRLVSPPLTRRAVNRVPERRAREAAGRHRRRSLELGWPRPHLRGAPASLIAPCPYPRLATTSLPPPASRHAPPLSASVLAFAPRPRPAPGHSPLPPLLHRRPAARPATRHAASAPLQAFTSDVCVVAAQLHARSVSHDKVQ